MFHIQKVFSRKGHQKRAARASSAKQAGEKTAEMICFFDRVLPALFGLSILITHPGSPHILLRKLQGKRSIQLQAFRVHPAGTSIDVYTVGCGKA